MNAINPFKSSQPKAAPQPAPVEPPSIEDPEVKEAEKRAKTAARLARGRRATLLTSGPGVTEGGDVNQRTLLGG